RPSRRRVGGRVKLIFEKSQPGRRGGELPRPDVPPAEVPAELRRASPPRLPELAEPEILRHFTELSTRNFGIDTGFYPLGSCTMKYNPRVNERAVLLPGFRDLHPYQDGDGSQGALELMWRLQDALIEAAGPRVPATWGSASSTSTCTRRSRSLTAVAGRAGARSSCATSSSRSCRCRP